MNTISAGDFIKQVAEATGCTQVQVKAILGAAGEQIKTNLKKGNEMHFIGFMNIGIKSEKAKPIWPSEFSSSLLKHSNFLDFSFFILIKLLYSSLVWDWVFNENSILNNSFFKVSTSSVRSITSTPNK